MTYLIELKSLLLEEKSQLERAIASAKKARDEAPSATESHSDTSRSQNERLVIALEEKLVILIKLINQVPATLEPKATVRVWDKVLLKGDYMQMEVVLVPEGFGGKKMGQTRLISVDSPLGANLMGKKYGSKFVQGAQKFTIEASKNS